MYASYLFARVDDLHKSLTVTGCIDPSALDRLDPDDAGGQYDSSGGISGAGNPIGSVCIG